MAIICKQRIRQRGPGSRRPKKRETSYRSRDREKSMGIPFKRERAKEHGHTEKENIERATSGRKASARQNVRPSNNMKKSSSEQIPTSRAVEGLQPNPNGYEASDTGDRGQGTPAMATCGTNQAENAATRTEESKLEIQGNKHAKVYSKKGPHRATRSPHRA